MLDGKPASMSPRVYDSVEVCTKVSLYLYYSMCFDLRHCAYLCTCITVYLLLACSCTKYCAVRILSFGCLLYSPLLLSYLLIGYEPRADSLNTCTCQQLLFATLSTHVDCERKASRVLCSDSEIGSDGSNWVIFKDRFAFAAAAAGLEKHIDGTGTPPNPPSLFLMAGLNRRWDIRS